MDRGGVGVRRASFGIASTAMIGARRTIDRAASSLQGPRSKANCSVARSGFDVPPDRIGSQMRSTLDLNLPVIMAGAFVPCADAPHDLHARTPSYWSGSSRRTAPGSERCGSPGISAAAARAMEMAPVTTTISEVVGLGQQRAVGTPDGQRVYVSAHAFAKKSKVEIVVHDDLSDEVVDLIASATRTGKRGDGVIFTSDVIASRRIRDAPGTRPA